MNPTRLGLIARVLGIIAALLAWTAVGIRYANTGIIRWELIAAGLFFGAFPFAMKSAQPPSSNDPKR